MVVKKAIAAHQQAIRLNASARTGQDDGRKDQLIRRDSLRDSWPNGPNGGRRERAFKRPEPHCHGRREEQTTPRHDSSERKIISRVHR
jgi:hypothetical protein